MPANTFRAVSAGRPQAVPQPVMSVCSHCWRHGMRPAASGVRNTGLPAKIAERGTRSECLCRALLRTAVLTARSYSARA